MQLIKSVLMHRFLHKEMHVFGTQNIPIQGKKIRILREGVISEKTIDEII